MINSKEDYFRYIELDKIALNKDKLSFKQRVKFIIFPDHIYRFTKLLRSVEYYKNCKTTFIDEIIYVWKQFRFKRLSLKLGFSIAPNVFGPGLAIVHYGTIVVHHNARVGAHCRIHACTNIGASAGGIEAPQIGDNVYIGSGAKIFGDITIGNNIAIAANAAVSKSFAEDNIMIGGVPARKIK
jgi:serine O-acetyltransferase